MEQMREEVDVERDWCLRNLINEAKGRMLDSIGDHYLIEQLNVSHATDTEEGHVLICQLGDCVGNCVIVNHSGILKVVDFDGPVSCD